MTRDELARVAADAMDYRDQLSIAGDVSRAYLHLYAIHQSSQTPPVEEAQPGPPSPSAPAAAYWPCWAVGEDFDANEADSKWDRYAI